jgi:excisionase family DNA binding protein
VTSADVAAIVAAAIAAAPPPRLALSPDEAAAALSVSRDFLDEHVIPELRIVRRGRRRMIPVRELEAWLEREAARALEDRRP